MCVCDPNTSMHMCTSTHRYVDALTLESRLVPCVCVCVCVCDPNTSTYTCTSTHRYVDTLSLESRLVP